MKYTGNKLFNRLLLVLAAVVVIVWLYPHQRTNKLLYEQGRPWNYSQLIAPFDIPIHPDSTTIDRIHDTLAERFVPIYTLNSRVIDSIKNEIPGPAVFKSRLTALLDRFYADGVVDTEVMAHVNDGTLPRIRVLEGNIMSERSTSGLMSPRELYIRLDSIISDHLFRQYFLNINLPTILSANLTYDESENRRLFDNEFQTLTADRGVILQGQAIINKGDIISAQDFTNLRTYEQLLEARMTSDSHSGLLITIGQVVYVSMLLALLLCYCMLARPEIFNRWRSVAFIFGIVTLFFVLSATISNFIPGGYYIIPLAIIPILMLVFFDARTAMFVSWITVLIIAPITTFSLEFIFLEIAAATVAVYTLRELSRRAQLLRTALCVAGTYILGYTALELLMNGSFDGFAWRMPVFLIANAVLTSMAYILMSAFERPFGFISSVTLAELADTNQPLLRELSDTCPGTFQHSMSVSNLASDAARAMGANVPLVRAGALYHDIGKMRNPAFFTENQHGVNPHDVLTPEQSARIVIGHVTDGLKMADKAGLPGVIKDFISEHHGAGRAKYFYYAYCQAHPDEANPDATAFTYPGPNPRTRETSLLMMADAVEAASRSLKDNSREAIAELVGRIIDGQIAEGLHANSTLEFRDIPIIKEAFVKRLMTMYHTRIAYPAGAIAPEPTPASAPQASNN